MRLPGFRQEYAGGLRARSLLALLMSAVVQALAQSASAAPAASWVDPVAAAAEILPQTARSLLLDVVRSGGHYVAVGARGVRWLFPRARLSSPSPRSMGNYGRSVTMA